MKKIVSSFLAVAMVFVLVACASPDVTITIPVEITSQEDVFSVEDFAENEDIKSYNENADGSVDITMSKKAHDELLVELRANIQDSADGILEQEVGFTDITFNDDISEFNFEIPADTYTEQHDFYAYLFLPVGYIYQVFAGVDSDNIEVVVNYKDGSEVIETFTYSELAEAEANAAP